MCVCRTFANSQLRVCAVCPCVVAVASFLHGKHKHVVASVGACCRYPPFFDEDVTNTYKKIVSGGFTFPTYFPVTARDLVRKLLQVSQSAGTHVAAV